MSGNSSAASAPGLQAGWEQQVKDRGAAYTPEDIQAFSSSGSGLTPEDIKMLTPGWHPRLSETDSNSPDIQRQQQLVAAYTAWRAARENKNSNANAYALKNNAFQGRDATILTGPEVNPNSVFKPGTLLGR